MDVHEIWFGRSVPARLSRAMLIPASWLYALGWQSYLGLYRFGIKQPTRRHRPVLCVGNLVVGGSGKTPVTLHVADLLQKLGHQPVLSMSAYGSPAAEAAQLAPSGELDPARWGDEPAMVRLLNPDLPIITGRRRVLAAEICAREFPQGVLLMDDGFQHLPLAKDVTILLEPRVASNPHCLPAGPYREPRQNRSRADLVLPDRFTVRTEITGYLAPDGTPHRPAKVDILCALGRPDRFQASVEATGVRVGTVRALPDHDPMSSGTLWEGLGEGRPIVVSAKDWVKLRRRDDLPGKAVLIARYAATIEPAPAFLDWLNGKILAAQAQAVDR